MAFQKQLFRVPITKFLELLVKIKLKRTKPVIIGITGSIGKTSTKEAVYEVLKTKWCVYRNPKSLNTEIGLLLAVLEQPSGFSSAIQWARILARACANALHGKKYDFLVLEYGADKPGDIEHLISVVKPNIAIITRIARTHQDEGQFESEEDVFKEKKKLVECLGKSEIAILNGADPLLQTLDGRLAAKTYWFSGGGNIFADNLKNSIEGVSADIHEGKEKLHAEFPIMGAFHVDALLPALLCGTLNGVPLVEGIRALQSFKLPPGRMSAIAGKHGSMILDSSYNASPEAVKQALALLHNLSGMRKIAVLGTMNELGAYAERGHREVGDAIGTWLDLLVTVGDYAHIIAEQALKNGFPEARIKILSSAREAGEFLLEMMKKDDIILFKGSQNRVRLERAVKMAMAHPEEAKHLLCRQESEWEKIG